MTHDPITEIPRNARTAKLFGQLSVAALIVSFILGFAIESIGINGLLMTVVIPLSILTILIAQSARRKMDGPSAPGFREATAGLRLGWGTLIATILFMVAVFAFFIQWLGN